jgi:cytoskeleton protein RodZ
MQASGHEHELSAARVALGAGAMLKRAREQTGLSAADVSARTRLELKVIVALESEDYASLAAAAFIKGYIRSIARELNIDPAPVLAQYLQQSHQEDPALADFSTRDPVQITSSSTLIRTISVVLALIVLVLIALWWQRNYQTGAQSEEALAELAAQSASQLDPGIPLPYSFTIVDHSTQPLGPVNSWRHQTDGSVPPAPPVSTESTIGAAAAAAPAEPGVAAPVTSVTSAEPAITPEPSNSAPATGELLLEGHGESWIEISDVAGKRLYFGMLKSGQQVGLTGKPPYDLVIGNSAAVAATFRGEAVDVRARAINGVARFSLGELH